MNIKITTSGTNLGESEENSLVLRTIYTHARERVGEVERESENGVVPNTREEATYMTFHRISSTKDVSFLNDYCWKVYFLLKISNSID